MENTDDKDKQIADLKSLLLSKNAEILSLRMGIQTLYDGALKMESKYSESQNVIPSLPCKCQCVKGSLQVAETQTFESDFVDQDSTQSALDWTADGCSVKTVTDLVRDVVESQSNSQSDYVYDENYNMYYSPSTGYYFDSIRNLLYEPQSQTYYIYDAEKNEYVIYCEPDADQNVGSTDNHDDRESQTTIEERHEKRPSRAKSKSRHKDKYINGKKSHKKSKGKHTSKKKGSSKQDVETFVPSEDSSLEEGEIPSDPSSPKDYNNASSPYSSFNEVSHQQWPPCIRAIVQESKSQKAGNLLMITCTGGVIGREKTNDICIPDISISREHAQVTFDNDAWQYTILDLNSQNGTFVNDKKLTGVNVPHPLEHGDILSIGSCKLLIHIHEGNNTCNGCEPGLILSEIAVSQVVNEETSKTSEQMRRENLKSLKKKFGLKDMNFVGGEKAIFGPNYQDRSQLRRVEKGSSNPHEKIEHPTSLDTALPSSNKGFKMLKNMGWNEGQALGTKDSGIMEPIELRFQSGKAGLGSEKSTEFPSARNEDRRSQNWKKAQKRFKDLEASEALAQKETE